MAEAETKLEYRLSVEQRELWKTSLPKLSCKQTEVAERLAKVAKGEVSSWRNTVSGFLKGKEGDLRSVFENPKRTAVLAKALGLSVIDLRLRLRAARAHGQVLRYGWRIPGFEDFGEFPILEALHPCPAGSGSACTDMCGRPSWSLRALVEIAQARPVKGGRIVALIDELEIDAEPALRWLEAKLEQLDRPVTDWRDPELRAGSIVIQPRLDRLSAAERDKLLGAIRDAHALLFVSTTISDSGADWPQDQIIYQPGRGTTYWATTYLEHLQRLLAQHGFSVDFCELRAWLEDDPRSSWVVERAPSLGLVARHVFEGRALPFTSTDLLEHSLERARARLARSGLAAEARLLKLCGERALGLVAAELCRRDTPQLKHQAVARHFVDAAEGLAGPKDWSQVAAPGMLGVVEELIEGGVFHECEGELSMVQRQLAVVALGHHFAGHLHEDELVDRAATTLHWHEAFLAAAEALGDPSPVIEVLMSRSVGVAHVAMPALTRVLECEARPRDEAAFARAYLRALAWWASRPPPPREQTRAIHYGPWRRRSALKTPDHQLDGRSALVALGQVSRRHRDVLPSDWTADTLLELEPDPASIALGHVALDATRAHTALLIGAPFQMAVFEDPQPWRDQQRVDDPREAITLGLTNLDYSLWWRTVAVARLEIEPDSDARLVGTKPGFSITVAMRQNERGTSMWSEALARVLASDPAGGGRAFVEVVSHFVDGGGRWNFEVVRRIWEGLDSTDQALLLPQVHAPLAERREGYWGLTDEESAWLMQTFFDSEGLGALWTEWRTHKHPRWRSFLAAGLPPSQILDWLLELETAPEPEMIILFEEPQPTDEVFAVLLRIDDPEFLVECELRAPDRWWHRASRRLREFDDVARVDLARLRGLQRWEVDPLRRELVARDIEPCVGDEETWLDLAEGEPREILRIERLFQADLAARTGEWTHTLRALDRLVEMLDAPLEHYDHWRLAVGTAEEEVSEAVAREVLREPVSTALTLLGEGLMNQPTPPERERVVTRMFTTPQLRACILGGVMVPWWVVASELLGEARALEIVRAGHDDRPQASAIRLRSMNLSRVSLLGLASDPKLGPAAAETLANRIADGVLDPLQVGEFAALLEDSELDLDSDAILTLVSSYLNTRPETLAEVVAIIERYLEPDARMPWWRHLSASVKAPRTVAVLLDALLASSKPS